MLLRLLGEAQEGKGNLALIDGVAGVGETRVAAEIAINFHARGVLTLSGACYDRDDPFPFIPFVEILETALAQPENLSVFREALNEDGPELARLLPQLRRIFARYSIPG